jgi:hypothetical protein
MATVRPHPNAWLWTIAALAGLVWGVIAVVFAAIGPSELVPRVFFSYHIEHFAAFYVLTIVAAAGFPKARLYQVVIALTVMALTLACIRMLIPHHRLSYAEDLAADIVGVLAASAPILVGRFREIASRKP